jgi:hypothetical protein
MIRGIFSVILMAGSVYAEGQPPSYAEATGYGIDNGAGSNSSAGGYQGLYPDLNEQMPVQPSVQPSAPPLGEEPNSNVRQPANQRHQPSFEERQQAFRAEAERTHQEFRKDAQRTIKEFDEKVRREREKREKELANIKLAGSVIEFMARTAPIWVDQFVRYPKLSMVSWTGYALGGYYYHAELRSNSLKLVGFLLAAFFTVPVVGRLCDWASSKMGGASTSAPKAAPKKEITVLVPVKVALR